jgi:hypothetical protein
MPADQTNSKFEQFLAQLLESTEEGSVRWQDTASDTTFSTALPSGIVHIERDQWPDEEGNLFPVYIAYLYDRRGRLAEELTGGKMSDQGLLSRLYQLARRSARDTEGLLDRVAADLQSKKTG